MLPVFLQLVRRWTGNYDFVDIPKLREDNIRFANSILKKLVGKTVERRKWKEWINLLEADGVRNYLLENSREDDPADSL